MKLKTKSLNNKNVALFGGTFNPIHSGHILTALDVLEKTDYDVVVFIPTSIPIHKETTELIDPYRRLDMVNIAVKGVDRFLSSDVEIKKGGFSRTIDTVEYFKNTFPDIKKIGVVFGDDLLDGLNTWKGIDKLEEITELLCLTRNITDTPKSNYKITFLKNRVIELSSSEIRNRVKLGLKINCMVPEKVIKYIYKNSLYKG
ncbi:MAG TPA: nicotinate-nucleotide adenylyltransferase [Spirochaetota bacterium]|jgi:nicotinate-nucleotide adenylyltransferase|nr:MAG: Nicotinate-nucleotide adenylyltransferase [Spirochaetes bacterium ADurb.Bin133]HNZ27113.1 nicotinate-nucleotide adenylyltransferase [Spirochaetota bacterium]HOE99925.1 nicotinate-nucleotide adenylyltransferase [Spirochaetota bacterium]HOS31583.1 nicotinate-nucleotide adenylyltransferase [Spirochaetota bacterium]HOS54770.1 nicotinate-nucleotide adenylyltransferase [Spirochaetota bacterium]